MSSSSNKRPKLSPEETQSIPGREDEVSQGTAVKTHSEHEYEEEEEVVEVIEEEEMEERPEVEEQAPEQRQYGFDDNAGAAQADEGLEEIEEEEKDVIEEETTEDEKEEIEEIEDDDEEEALEQEKGETGEEDEDADETEVDAEDYKEGADKEEEDKDDDEGTDRDDVERETVKTEDIRDNGDLVDEDGDRRDDEGDEEEGDDEEEADDTRLNSIYADPEEMERRKKLAALMCFSSLQSLMGMELCKDTTPPTEEICSENSTILPLAFLKLVMLAVTSLMQEESRRLQQSGSEWSHIDRGVGSVDAVTRDAMWRRKYSMSYTCFLYVVEELRPFIHSDPKLQVTTLMEIERAVAMVIYRLAHGLSSEELAEKYNVSASTVDKYTLVVASALADANKLYGQYMAIPTGNRMARILSHFQKITGIPNICGAIDGTHIKLYFKPEKCYTPSAYRSPYNFHSILLQAVCDPNKLFWDVCCMAPGGTHDASHFMTSNLYQKIKEGVCLQEPVITVEGREIAPFMVGDSAYPLRPFLIKPFDSDDALRKAFDDQIFKALTSIESAFVVLKSRWRILKCMNVHLMHAPQIAVACCVLHNICQLWGEPEPQQQHVETHSNNHSQGSLKISEDDDKARIAGETVREAVFRHWVKKGLDNAYSTFGHGNM